MATEIQFNVFRTFLIVAPGVCEADLERELESSEASAPRELLPWKPYIVVICIEPVSLSEGIITRVSH